MSTPRTKAPLRLFGVAVVFVGAAFGCYFALDDEKRGTTPGATAGPPAAIATEGGGAETLSRSEWNARTTAGKAIEQQPVQQQRRYHETWLAALQRTQEASRQSLEQLEAQGEALRGDAAGREAMHARVAALRSSMTDRSVRMERHAAAVSSLR